MTTTNTYQVIDKVTREALTILKNKLGLGNRCLRQYDDEFDVAGAKIGDTLRIRIPPRYVTTTGPAPSLQNFTQNQVPVAAQAQLNVALEFTSKDLTLFWDSFKEQFIAPAAVQLASSIDQLGFNAAVANTISAENVTYNGNYAGFQSLVTPGNFAGNSAGGYYPTAWNGTTLNQGLTAQQAVTTFFNAQAQLDNMSAMTYDRYAVLSPYATAATAGAQATLFNPQTEIGDQFKEGLLGIQAGAMWHTSQNVTSFQAGNWTQSSTCQVATTSVDGATSLVVKGFGVSDTINAGDQFVIAGVYEVNYITRVSTGHLQVFTAISTPTNNGSGGFTINIHPTINSPTSPQYQTVSALPQAGAQITMMGTAGAVTSNNLMYQKEALALVTAPLYDPSEDGAFGTVIKDPEDGFALRYVRQYQVLIDQTVPRLDCLVGWAVPRPELGCLMRG
jgi:hypothetical protein